MSRPIRKLIALLLAVWLPLFGGNALAGSVAMQSKSGDCHAAVAQQNGHHSQHQYAPQAQLAAHHDTPSGQHDQQNSSCQDHSPCHLVCCGYVAGSALVIAVEQQPDHAFTPYLVTPRTLTLPLFDPPPLARA
ncbi:MAG: DUF2946 domain-containing protein [Gallionella sp.]|nr:DUF2946 domain-containing protein [Gallionella sp.]